MSIILPEHTDQAIADAVQNVTQPLSISVGDTFKDLWFLTFGGISFNAEKRKIKYATELEKYKIETEKKIFAIPEPDLKDPDIQIAGQALEKSKYCIEHEDLRSMFSSLVASSMMRSKEEIIHPSFSEIITQISPEDARALKRFRRKERHGIITVKLTILRKETYHVLLSNVWYPYNSLDICQKSDMIINSLTRLGLLNVDYTSHLTDNRVYIMIYNPELQDYIESKAVDLTAQSGLKKTDYEIDIDRGIIELTPMGRNFLECVL